MHRTILPLATLLVLAAAPSAMAQDAANMSFFVTSAGVGDGANLGGLDGADAHCQKLAEAAGSTGKTWHAYLSTGGDGAVNARDRIGSGPWVNAKGVQIAANVDELHGDANKINKETALDEKGNTVKGRGDEPNQHDILTGTQRDGTAFAGAEDMTCKNWTSNGEGAAMVGHHDLIGNPQNINFWNFSHPSRGCSQANLEGTGGAGFLYCFATN
ncbi:MAG TPA: hypothetical protein VJS40_06340 [Aestuariivirgaceae bacterium]|nr:hypothetical protein [Aestuariivirgaceae bacterium]